MSNPAKAYSFRTGRTNRRTPKATATALPANPTQNGSSANRQTLQTWAAQDGVVDDELLALAQPSGRQGTGTVTTTHRPEVWEDEGKREARRQAAREVPLAELVTNTAPRRGRAESYEIVVQPAARVIALADSVPVLSPAPAGPGAAPGSNPIRSSATLETDDEWERIGMDGEVEPFPSPGQDNPATGPTKSWASVVTGLGGGAGWIRAAA